MSGNVETRKIMTKPLPEILDEIEESIGLANEAAKMAREAAGEARNAGEKAAKDAAMEVRKAADKSLDENIKIINERIEKSETAINIRLTEVEQLSELLKTAIIEGITAVEIKISGKVSDVSSNTPKKRKPN